MKRKVKKGKVFILFLLLLIIVVCSYFLLNNKDKEEKSDNKPQIKEEKPKPNLKTFDLYSNTRNIAFMYNNISDVWGVQAGLEEAYLVYEIIVEGGYTRLMAIFKDKDLSKIGCIRSSRPYYLDYALENDAIYIHFGASNQALKDIKSLGVNNINLMYYDAGYYRDKSLNLATEHTAFTTSKRIDTGISKYNYRTTTDTKPVLNYSFDEVDLSKRDDAIKADSVFIDYSAVRNTSYIYDSTNKVYLRSQGTAKKSYKHKDGITKKQYTAKNIIVYQVKNYRIDSHDRQALNNIGSGTGYYITNGYAIPITWSKTSRASKTEYRDLNGKEIEVNDGNTYIQIQPLGRELNIK